VQLSNREGQLFSISASCPSLLTWRSFENAICSELTRPRRINLGKMSSWAGLLVNFSSQISFWNFAFGIERKRKRKRKRKREESECTRVRVRV